MKASSIHIYPTPTAAALAALSFLVALLNIGFSLGKNEITCFDDEMIFFLAFFFLVISSRKMKFYYCFEILIYKHYFGLYSYISPDLTFLFIRG